MTYPDGYDHFALMKDVENKCIMQDVIGNQFAIHKDVHLFRIEVHSCLTIQQLATTSRIYPLDVIVHSNSFPVKRSTWHSDFVIQNHFNLLTGLLVFFNLARSQSRLKPCSRCAISREGLMQASA